MDGSAATRTAGTFDPLDAEFVRDPHPLLAAMRQQCPVARGERWGGFWALLSYDEVTAAATAPAQFSSADGIVIPRNPVAGRRAPMHYDPPEHIRFRRALNPPFAGAVVAGVAADVRRVAVELVDRFRRSGGGEFVEAVASPYATRVLTCFLNLAEEDAGRIQKLTEQFELAQTNEDTATAEAISQQLYAVARDAVAARRRNPLPADSDVISALLSADVVGSALSDEFVAGTMRQLLVAGHVPVSLSLASAALHLGEDQELQARLRAEPELIERAIDELLRLYTPNEGFARTATADVEVSGQHIRAGERVALVYTAANRDPAVFPDADTFVLDRSPNRHLAFGHGVHKCVGVHLARLELRVLLEQLIAAGPFYVAEQAGWSHWPEYGPSRLMLSFSASP